MGNPAWHGKMYTHRWVDRFKVGRKTLNDEDWSGQPSTSQLTTVLKWMHWLKKIPSDYRMFGTQKKPCMDQDMPVIMKFRTQCMCGFDHNQKLPLQMGSTGLWTATEYVLKIGVIILRNYKLCICHIAVHEVIQKLTWLVILPHMIYVWQYV